MKIKKGILVKNTIMTAVLTCAALWTSGAVSAENEIVWRDCPKCEMEIRISQDGKTAYINEARLQGATRDERVKRAKILLERGRLPPQTNVKRPLMGWSSWNTFAVDISEDIILETARAMATNGLKEAGYVYVNIDDGFFDGHGPDGRLRFHPRRFPNGMKVVVDGIHALGLKAGIYSDAGADTCGSMSNRDRGGVGAGLYGHDAEDCKLHFNELGFDFIKVDYCGGGRLKLDERKRYTEIAKAIKATGREDVRFNICRWAFPGTWAADIAESWRTTGDIRANWGSVRGIIRENLYLGAYIRPGAYNDMDMLEVGHLKGSVKTNFGRWDTGLTPNEETLHFGTWCMMSSPLLIGCDVRRIPESTMELITNPYLLAMSQNDLGLQGEVASRQGENAYVLAKDADTLFGTSRYVEVMNLGDEEADIEVRAADLLLGGKIECFDLVERGDPGSFTDSVTLRLRPHSGRFFRFDAERRIERTRYEAEGAFMSEYQELKNPVEAGTAHPDGDKNASGGMVVKFLGNRETNDLVFKNVKIERGGKRRLVFRYASPDDRRFFVQVDGGEKVKVESPRTNWAFKDVAIEATLDKGLHEIRVSNADAWAPDLDMLTIE